MPELRELHRPIPVDRVGPNGLDVVVEATPGECAALATRMQVPAVLSLTCAFHLTRLGHDQVMARGRLSATLTQTCIVTAEDFDTAVEEDFTVRFVPEAEVTDDLDLDAEDEIPIEGKMMDLGEAAAEQLGLAIDPYPRMPGAELPEFERDDEDNPFAALSSLKRPN